MRRRDFLSMVSCAALAAVVPKRTYHFLNGLWQPNQPLPEGYVFGCGSDQPGVIYWSSVSDPNRWPDTLVDVKEVWHPDGHVERFVVSQGKETLFESIPNLAWPVKPPAVVLCPAPPPWGSRA